MLQNFQKAHIRQIINKYTPYYFLAPVIVLVLGFVVYPILNVFYYSFFNYNPAKIKSNGFVGFNNYIKLFTEDEVFVDSLLVSLKWVVIVVALQLVLGLIMSLLLNISFKGRGLIRATIFAPWALSGVMIAILWFLILNQNIGVLNDLLLRIGLISEPIAWLANPSTAFGAVVIAELWGGVPFFAITILAQLQSIPNETYEACSIDGGNSIQKFRFIIIPHLKDTIVLNSLLRAVWEINAVDIILNLTGGGPMSLTSTLSIYLTNQAIKTRNFGYGSAIGVVSFIIMLLFSLVYLKLNKYGEE